MFSTMMNAANKFGGAKLRNAVLAASALAGLGALPTAAFARHPDFRFGFYAPAPAVYVAPDCQPQRQWVEPVYQTVTEQVWVPAGTTTQIQQVEVPAQYGWRDVVSYNWFGHPRHYQEQVVISPAHYEDRPGDAVVIPAHYEQQTHQQLVCAGHWQEISTPVVVRPGIAVGLPLPF